MKDLANARSGGCDQVMNPDSETLHLAVQKKVAVEIL